MSKGSRFEESQIVRFIKHIWLEYSIIVVTVIIFMIAGVLAPRFVEISNILVILRQASIIGVIAMGMTFVIITGGIDLSSGHVVATSGAVLMILQPNPNVPLIFAILAAFATAALIGAVNGFIITKARVPAFIVTLAVGIIARSVALYLVEGRAITGDRDDFAFRNIGTGSIGFMPFSLLIWIILAILLGCILKYTKFGSHVYAVGGNEVASRYSGISVHRTKIIAYTIVGFCAGLSALLDISRTVTIAVPTAGHMYEFEAITAVVIGGVALSGGRGKMLNVFFGVVIVTVVSNLMAMLGLSVFLTGFVKGTVILVAVLLQRREKVA
jgi:ribose transport system permease protein